MQQLFRYVQNNTFIRHNAIYFIGTLAIGALNYLYYPILGRMLAPNSFGEVQTLFSLFAQIVIFLSVLGLVTVNIVTNYHDSTKTNTVILELEKLSLGFGLLVVLCSLVAANTLKGFFNFSSAVPFIVLAIAILVTVPVTFRNAYLRGKQKFGLVAWAGITSAAGDIIFSVLFVLMHGKTTGAITGLVIAQISELVFVAIVAYQFGFVEHIRNEIIQPLNLRLVLPELKYASMVLIGSLGITIFYSMDILLVKHYFNAHVAGLYAGISTVGRIIFFLTASVAQVLMPAIKLAASPTQNQQILFKSLVLLLLIGGAAWIAFALAPRLIIRILMGSKYLPYADLLPRFSLSLLIVSIVNLLVIYQMALRRYMAALLVVIGVAVTIVLVTLHHANLSALVNSLLFGSVALLILVISWMAVPKVKNYLQA